VRDEVEIVRTKGIFTRAEYESFLAKIAKYGNFTVLLTAEKQNAAGVRGKLFNLDRKDTENRVIDQPFKTGDFIKIFIESANPSLFTEILNRNFMFGYSGGGKSGFKMQSTASAMVCSDGFLRGVEVINMINKYKSIPGNTVKLFLQSYDIIPNPPVLRDPPYEFTTTYDNTVSEHEKNWIDYEGRYFMDFTIDTTTCLITEYYFKEQLK